MPYFYVLLQIPFAISIVLITVLVPLSIIYHYLCGCKRFLLFAIRSLNRKGLGNEWIRGLSHELGKSEYADFCVVSIMLLLYGVCFSMGQLVTRHFIHFYKVPSFVDKFLLYPIVTFIGLLFLFLFVVMLFQTGVFFHDLALRITWAWREAYDLEQGYQHDHK